MATAALVCRKGIKPVEGGFRTCVFRKGPWTVPEKNLEEKKEGFPCLSTGFSKKTVVP